ncbi:MAG TPA: STAS domain-containing protein [Chthoniobacterales bacterium]
MKPAPRLTVDEKKEGPDRVLTFQGTADILCLQALQDRFDRLARENVRLLAINLAATDFINSPVWAVITLYARTRAHTARVAIVGMPDRIRESFEMMGLQKELASYPNLAAARDGLGLETEA